MRIFRRTFSVQKQMLQLRKFQFSVRYVSFLGSSQQRILMCDTVDEIKKDQLSVKDGENNYLCFGDKWWREERKLSHSRAHHSPSSLATALGKSRLIWCYRDFLPTSFQPPIFYPPLHLRLPKDTFIIHISAAISLRYFLSGTRFWSLMFWEHSVFISKMFLFDKLIG